MMPVNTTSIMEGTTRLLVPADSLRMTVPPRHPAFFNPRARRTRDLTVLASEAHAEQRSGKYLDVMAGVGARGLRVAGEVRSFDVILNDVNLDAINMARRSADLNGLDDVEFSTAEACRFLQDHSARGERGTMVDVDPFGSPAPYLDCALRAVEFGGMLAVTATDLQVLGGLHDEACRRIYGGVPLRTAYGAETAIRLIVGCMGMVAGRLNVGIIPLYTESHMHYYRAYARMMPKPGPHRAGYIVHCDLCGHRQAAPHGRQSCRSCGGTTRSAGPLWLGRLFDEEFVHRMIRHDAQRGGQYSAHLETCLHEASMPAAFYTLDEMASRARCGPPSLRTMISRLHSEGFTAEATSFSPVGFRTDAPAAEICSMILAAKSHTHQV